MLAHLQHFNLTPLLEHLDVRHILLLDLLDGDLRACLLMNSKLDEPKLSFAERFIHGVVVKDICLLHGIFKALLPFSAFRFLLEENYP